MIISPISFACEQKINGQIDEVKDVWPPTDLDGQRDSLLSLSLLPPLLLEG